MTYITHLIKGSTYHIIAVTTIWALINNQPISYYFKYNIEFYDTYLTYKTMIGVGVSFYVMSKYY